MERDAREQRKGEAKAEKNSEGEPAEMKKLWFCEECGVAMERTNEDFCKCPSCGAEVWEEGEGGYKGNRKEAEITEKIHGKWFCQKCREEMTIVDGDFCKCPSCGAEVWYGRKNKQYEPDEIKELMDAYSSSPMTVFEAMIGGRAAKGKGGGRSKGRTRKKNQQQKPTTEELYQRLKNRG